MSNLSPSDLVDALRDPSLSFEERARAARVLLAESTDETMATFQSFLQRAPQELRAAVAEGLGTCRHAEARQLLLGLLDDPDISVARGAIRGLAARGDAEAISVLGSIIRDHSGDSSVREEAALALGEIEDPAAMLSLTEALRESQDPGIRAFILEGIGSRPLSETRELFEELLGDPGVSSKEKVATLEALGNAKGDATPMLLGFGADSDPEVREAAALAISSLEETGDSGAQIVALLEREEDSSVRRRLYQALTNQTSFPIGNLERLIFGEDDVGTRLAGFGAVAEFCRSRPAEPVVQVFDRLAVPELESTALEDPDLARQLEAMIVLRKARTPQAMKALEAIASRSI